MDEFVFDNEYLAMARGFGVKEFGDKLAEAMKREPKEQKKKSFSPSSFYIYGNGVCPRYWYYAFHGTTFEYESSPTAAANMDAGTDSGERLANLLDKAGLLVEAEAKATYEDPPIFGYIDAVVNWKGEEVIAEVKTTKAATWNDRAVNNKVPGYQLLQLLIYLYVTNHEKGFFITENKDDHRLFILPVKMTDENKELVERVFDWMRMVKKNSDDDKLPKRPFTKSSYNCKGCPVKSACWGEGGFRKNSVNDPNPGVVDLPPLEVPK